MLTALGFSFYIIACISEEAGRNYIMRIASSLKTLKARDKNCRVIRRKGRVFVINKMKPRFKARQG